MSCFKDGALIPLSKTVQEALGLQIPEAWLPGTECKYKVVLRSLLDLEAHGSLLW